MFDVRPTLAALLLLGLAAPAAGQCQIDRAYLQGPERVVAGEPYTISWPNVLSGPRDSYQVERATNPDFTAAERIQTTRPAQTFTAPLSGTLYHRVLFTASCLGPVPPPASNTLVVEVSDCALTASPAALKVTPEKPPAFSTYVVWWGPGTAEPVSGRFLYRLRRTTPYEVRESVSEYPSAAFTDPPGEYAYQVRLELPCGAAGPWSAALKVTVGGAVGTLVLVSDPAPVDLASSPEKAETAFSVRNGGTQPVQVTVTTGPIVSLLSPATPLTLAPNQTQRFSVRFAPLPPSFPAPTIASWVQLQTGDGGVLNVPVGLFGGLSAESPVTWDRSEIVLPRNGQPVEATFRNAGTKTALVYGRVREPWLTVEPTDGQAWDRPLAAGEARTVRLRLDRSRRRAPDGTEVARVSLATSGFGTQPQDLAVIDDGPLLSPATGAVDPPSTSGGTRILYASMPNAVDARGVGRYTGDLWLSNLDSVSPTDVQLLLSPLGQKGQNWRFVVRLAPGETRRYRNLMGSLVGYEGACAVEVRSASAAVSATALVSNVPFDSTLAQRARLAGGTGGGTGAGQYGFELRPVAPGEGVKASDDKYVLTGLAHDARRRTNLLLTETSGYDTKVLVELFESTRGDPILINGNPVQVTVTVPALGTVQLNDADLFPATIDPLNVAPYARLTWLESTLASDGTYKGAVVPFATVIDQATQDASLRVGVSPRALDPIPSSQPTTAARTPEMGLPFSGGPAPLLLPVAHAIGGPLASGDKPFWRTRVTLTNTSEREQRTVKLRVIDKTGTIPFDDLHSPTITLTPKAVYAADDILEAQFGLSGDTTVYGAVQIEAVKKTDGSGAWQNTWADVDVQTETYTPDPGGATGGEFKTGMEGFSYLHGYSSFQSNLGTVQIEGAESSSSFRTNLILEEVGGAYCQVAVSAYRSGSFVPLATASVLLPAFDYVSKDLFRDILGLDLADLSDIRVVVRQIDGDGVFMAFASKIDLRTGDPANLFLRPASAGTGR